jgi:hypothetical protein
MHAYKSGAGHIRRSIPGYVLAKKYIALFNAFCFLKILS